MGPRLQLYSICSMVCSDAPQVHSLLSEIFHLCRFFAVLPTLALALLSVTHSFLGRSEPLGRFLLGCWTASLFVVLSHSLHLSSLRCEAAVGSRLSASMKLLRDLSLFLGWTCPKRVCLGSVSCLCSFVIFLVSQSVVNGGG